MSEKIRAPYIVRTMSQDQIERGQKLQAAMESLDAESKRELAEENRLADEQQRVEQEQASIEETRRAASPAGRYMNAKYDWVNNPTKG